MACKENTCIGATRLRQSYLERNFPIMYHYLFDMTTLVEISPNHVTIKIPKNKTDQLRQCSEVVIAKIESDT